VLDVPVATADKACGLHRDFFGQITKCRGTLLENSQT